MAPDITLAICTHDRYDVIDGAIKSLELQDLDHERFEVIIVDNSSDKHQQTAFLSKLDLLCPHQVIVEDIPGLSRARNAAVRAARAPIVAFLDDDAQASPRWAINLIECFQRNSSAGIVGAPVRPIWPTPRPSWIHPWLEGFLTIIDRGDIERPLNDDEWLAGTNIAFLREPLLKVGLFDEKLGRIGRMLLSNEELAVTKSIRALGHSVIYCPKAEMHHTVHLNRLTQSWFRRRVFWQAISDLFDHEDTSPIEQHIDTVFDFLDRLAPRDRGLVGLFKNIDNADLFHAQTTAVNSIVHILATDPQDLREYLQSKAR